MRLPDCALALCLAACSARAAEHFVFGLAPESTASVTGPGAPDSTRVSPSGSARFVADASGSFQVSTIVVAPCPDLTVAAMESKPLAPACGDTVKVRALVRNIGDGASGSGSLLRFSADGSPVQSVPTPGLAAGGESWSPWVSLGPLGSGPHEVEVCADATGTIREKDEGNNCR